MAGRIGKLLEQRAKLRCGKSRSGVDNRYARSADSIEGVRLRSASRVGICYCIRGSLHRRRCSVGFQAELRQHLNTFPTKIPQGLHALRFGETMTDAVEETISCGLDQTDLAFLGRSRLGIVDAFPLPCRDE